jgi:hypothetical protein
MLAKLTADPNTLGIGTRVYPEYARQSDKVYPLAVFKVENESRQLASDGPTGLVTCDYVIAAIAPTYKAASQLADLIETALNGKTWADTTNGVNIQGCFLADDGRREDMATNNDTEAANLYVTELTFNVFSNAL